MKRLWPEEDDFFLDLRGAGGVFYAGCECAVCAEVSEQYRRIATRLQSVAIIAITTIGVLRTFGKDRVWHDRHNETIYKIRQLGLRCLCICNNTV